MFMFLNKKKMGLVFVMIFQKKKQGISKDILNTIEELLIETFFKIMETKDLTLLNPKKVKVSQEQLNQAWDNIREQYYKNSNESKYQTDLKENINIKLLELEIVACTMCIAYFELTGEVHESFKSFGYNVNSFLDINNVKQKISIKKTKLSRLLLKKDNIDKDEIVKFWDQVATLEGSMSKFGLLNGRLDIKKTTVARWISYVKQVNNVIRQNRQR